MASRKGCGKGEETPHRARLQDLHRTFLQILGSYAHCLSPLLSWCLLCQPCPHFYKTSFMCFYNLEFKFPKFPNEVCIWVERQYLATQSAEWSTNRLEETLHCSWEPVKAMPSAFLLEAPIWYITIEAFHTTYSDFTTQAHMKISSQFFQTSTQSLERWNVWIGKNKGGGVLEASYRTSSKAAVLQPMTK